MVAPPAPASSAAPRPTCGHGVSLSREETIMPYRRLAICVVVALIVGSGSAWAQIAVTDPATTGRNAIIAALKRHIVDTARVQHERLVSMAQRLSALTSLNKYATPERPEPGAYEAGDALIYGDSYRAALRYGDATGDAYVHVARTRRDAADALARL